MTVRPKKTVRLDYWGEDTDDMPHLTLLADPGEARLAAGNDAFISVTKDRISLGAGKPSTVNIQGLSGSMKYAGLMQGIDFPLTLIPSTLATPIPQQRIDPPLKELIPLLNDLRSVLSGFLV